MLFGKKIKLPDDLIERAEAAAEAVGCSLNELIARAVEREIATLAASASPASASQSEVQNITNKLRGLGYLE